MELPQRKQNRLREYDYGTEGSYFVTLCTQNRALLFQTELPVGNDLCVVPQKQNQIVHKWVKETQNKFPNITIDKYVIMPDHLHFIITIQERHIGRSLPDVMRFFKTMTTNEYLREIKNNASPPIEQKLWQKSYYDHVIRNQEDYNQIWEYIENNPQRWAVEHSGEEK